MMFTGSNTLVETTDSGVLFSPQRHGEHGEEILEYGIRDAVIFTHSDGAFGHLESLDDRKI